MINEISSVERLKRLMGIDREWVPSPPDEADVRLKKFPKVPYAHQFIPSTINKPHVLTGISNFNSPPREHIVPREHHPSNHPIHFLPHQHVLTPSKPSSTKPISHPRTTHHVPRPPRPRLLPPTKRLPRTPRPDLNPLHNNAAHPSPLPPTQRLRLHSRNRRSRTPRPLSSKPHPLTITYKYPGQRMVGGGRSSRRRFARNNARQCVYKEVVGRVEILE